MDAAARGEHWTRKVEETPGEPEPPPRPVSSTPLTTVLLRHGETPLSIEKRFAGIGDVPLTANGVAQARAAALALKDRGLDAIVTSPLSRCRSTAAEVAAVTGLDVRVEDGFRETDFGEWEGSRSARRARGGPPR